VNGADVSRRVALVATEGVSWPYYVYIYVCVYIYILYIYIIYIHTHEGVRMCDGFLLGGHEGCLVYIHPSICLSVPSHLLCFVVCVCVCACVCESVTSVLFTCEYYKIIHSSTLCFTYPTTRT
jgi:hypothetical protein